jgi:mono/diheme cytochrome c family protein
MSLKYLLILLAGQLCLGAPALAANGTPSLEEGKKLFNAHCAACHGKRGKGDGPAGRALATPPYNLTWSVAKDDYLRQIIPKGGEAMDRSPDMPPWGEKLSPQEIESVILYIKTLRVAQ